MKSLINNLLITLSLIKLHLSLILVTLLFFRTLRSIPSGVRQKLLIQSKKSVATKEMAQTRRLNKECEEPTFGVGSIGKVRVLMMQELDSVSSKTRPTNATVPVSVYCCEKRKRSVQVKKTKSDQSNSTSTGCKSSNLSSDKRISSGISSRKKVHHQSPSAQSIPMLESEDISLERTPARGCQERRKTRIVEIVDLKCGNSEKGWSSPITDQLRRLSFSKLSD